MATGPEHYREAERLIAEAEEAEGGSNVERHNLAAAQVHATLALAAAMGTYGNDETRTGADVAAWERCAGEDTAQANREKASTASTGSEG